jgi:NRAMP (natural resistance-associated macrophage protein)-like metal ion transporter
MAPKTRGRPHHHRHHPHRRGIFGFGYFKALGPGIITGASDDDPSGIGTYSQAGAAFRFDLLWTALIALPLATAVQETTGRLALTTGKGLAALIKDHFPRWILYGAVVLVVVANTVNLGADLGAMAEAIRLLIPIPYIALLLGVTALVLGLEVFLPYRRYARILRWLCLSLGAYIVVLFMINVNWAEVIRQTLIPHLRGDPAYHAAIIAILGTTISPYLFFWQASDELEQRGDLKTHGPLTGSQLKAMRVDTMTGMFSAVAVMWAIMVAAGATLNPAGITTVETATQAAEALKPLAGQFAGLLFTLGIVGTGLLAVPVLAGSAGYALAETFGWREGLSKKFRRAPGFYLAIAAATLIGLALNFTGINPIRALFFAAILNGLAAPPLILLMMILGNSKKLLGNRRSRWLSNTLVGTALVLMTGLPIAYILRVAKT